MEDLLWQCGEIVLGKRLDGLEIVLAWRPSLACSTRYQYITRARPFAMKCRQHLTRSIHLNCEAGKAWKSTRAQQQYLLKRVELLASRSREAPPHRLPRVDLYSGNVTRRRLPSP